MTLLDSIVRAVKALLEPPNRQPDPETATREEIAEWCGIEYDTAPEGAVPVDQYRSQGRVYCERTGRQPDPPWVVVAEYGLPGGGTAVLSHERYAEELRDHYDLTEPESEVVALHCAGWMEPEMRQKFTPLGRHASDAADLLDSGREKIDGPLTPGAE